MPGLFFYTNFPPDGSRVFRLDTGNGIIAFSLAPRLAAPTICSQPQTNFYAAGALAFVDVGGSGHLPQYQWRKNGVNILGATNRTLDIPNFQAANAGLYFVVISNSLNNVTSSNALLDILMLVTTQPASQVVAPGGTANLNVAVSGGTGIYTYQWKFNGTNISLATNSTLNVTNAQVANAGSYTVVITDSLTQAITSQTAILSVGSAGTGTGLRGDYYTSQTNFNGTPTLTRVDATVNYDFGAGSPDPSISVDLFAVRWFGQVQPLYSQTYTFYTRTDDGARLWVKGQNLVDKWVNQGPTEWSGTITLTANQKYDILMEYYENAVGAVAQLSWSSPSQGKQIIPMTQLYPGASPIIPPPLGSSLSGTNFVLNWSGTFILQTATDVTGPYVDVGGAAVSPYTNSITTDPQRFFRLRNPTP